MNHTGISKRIVLYLGPILLIYALSVFLPLFKGVWYSLNEIVYFQMKFNGLKNYFELLNDTDFWNALKNNFIIIFTSIFFQIFVGFIIAVMVHTRVALFPRFIRTVIFFPVILAPVVIALIWIVVFDYNNGLLNNLLELLGQGDFVKTWLGDPNIVIYSVTVPIVWQYIGLYFVIFSAGLSSIESDVLEAAQIDGANFLQTLFGIIIPMMLRTWRVALVLAFAGGLKIFEHIFVMTGGGPGVASTVVAQYAYNQSVMRTRFDYASTVAISIVLISALIILCINIITSIIIKKVEE